MRSPQETPKNVHKWLNDSLRASRSPNQKGPTAATDGKKRPQRKMDTVIRTSRRLGYATNHSTKIPQHVRYHSIMKFRVWRLGPKVLGSNPRFASFWLCELKSKLLNVSVPKFLHMFNRAVVRIN